MAVATLGAISAGFSVLGGIAGMQAGRQNAANAKAEGKQAVITANANADRERRSNEQQLASIRATIGAQGSTMEGSPMLVYLDAVKNGELNAQTIEYGGKLKQISKNAEADIYKRQAFTSLLGGFASAGRSLGSTLLASNGGSATLFANQSPQYKFMNPFEDD